MIRRLVLTLGALCLFASGPTIGADHAVILLYHHVSEDTPSQTSVTPAQFEQHLEIIETQGFTVVALDALLERLSRGQSLPEKAVVITFDDAYASVYTEAFPRLRERGWPFTVFVADQPVDRAYGHFMSWAQIGELVNAGAGIGGHSTAHGHLVRRETDETSANWIARTTADITANRTRLSSTLQIPISSFAWPYGETTPELERALSQLGLFGLGQQSGAVGAGSSLTFLPRYPMMSTLASPERLMTALKSRPLPVFDIEAGELQRSAGDPPGKFEFSLEKGPFQIRALACYSASGESLNITRREQRISVQLPPFKPGRNKVNCTVPLDMTLSAGDAENGVYFWHSQQWLVTQSDGRWYEER